VPVKVRLGLWRGRTTELLKALRDPTDAGHERMIDWVGEDFDPEDFSMAEINERLEALATSESDIGKI